MGLKRRFACDLRSFPAGDATPTRPRRGRDTSGCLSAGRPAGRAGFHRITVQRWKQRAAGAATSRRFARAGTRPRPRSSARASHVAQRYYKGAGSGAAATGPGAGRARRNTRRGRTYTLHFQFYTVKKDAAV